MRIDSGSLAIEGLRISAERIVEASEPHQDPQSQSAIVNPQWKSRNLQSSISTPIKRNGNAKNRQWTRADSKSPIVNLFKR